MSCYSPLVSISPRLLRRESAQGGPAGLADPMGQLAVTVADHTLAPGTNRPVILAVVIADEVTKKSAKHYSLRFAIRAAGEPGPFSLVRSNTGTVRTGVQGRDLRGRLAYTPPAGSHGLVRKSLEYPAARAFQVTNDGGEPRPERYEES